MSTRFTPAFFRVTTPCLVRSAAVVVIATTIGGGSASAAFVLTTDVLNDAERTNYI